MYISHFFTILNRWLNDKYFISVYNDSCQRGTAMKYRVSEYLLHLVCWQMTISYLNIWIMSAINSMNKVRQCFEVCGKISNSRKGEEVREAVGVQWWIPGRRKPSRKTHIAEMFALNCTELPGAAIDACGAGISLRGISVAAGMTEVKPIMHSALTVEKSAYNGSSRWK